MSSCGTFYEGVALVRGQKATAMEIDPNALESALTAPYLVELRDLYIYIFYFWAFVA